MKTDFLIEYGFSNQLAIYGTWKSLSYHSDLYDGDIVSSALNGVGFTYFMEEEAPATFITGTIGQHFIGLGGVFGEPEEDLASGLGVGIGVGREFKKNWLVGIDGFWGRPGEPADDPGFRPHPFGPNSVALSVYVSHLFY